LVNILARKYVPNIQQHTLEDRYFDITSTSFIKKSKSIFNSLSRLSLLPFFFCLFSRKASKLILPWSNARALKSCSEGSSPIARIIIFACLTDMVPSGSVNELKMIKLAESVERLIRWQKEPYKLEQDIMVQKLLFEEIIKLRNISEEYLYDLADFVSKQ